MKTFTLLFALMVAGLFVPDLTNPDKRRQLTQTTLALGRHVSFLTDAVKPHLAAETKSDLPVPPPKRAGFILIQRAGSPPKAHRVPARATLKMPTAPKPAATPQLKSPCETPMICSPAPVPRRVALHYVGLKGGERLFAGFRSPSGS